MVEGAGVLVARDVERTAAVGASLRHSIANESCRDTLPHSVWVHEQGIELPPIADSEGGREAVDPVVIVGHARAPGGQAFRGQLQELRVSRQQRTITCIGERGAAKDLLQRGQVAGRRVPDPHRQGLDAVDRELRVPAG